MVIGLMDPRLAPPLKLRRHAVAGMTKETMTKVMGGEIINVRMDVRTYVLT